MPTEAMDPEQPTETDLEAQRQFQEANPDAVIVPVSGRSAISGQGVAFDNPDGSRCELTQTQD